MDRINGSSGLGFPILCILSIPVHSFGCGRRPRWALTRVHWYPFVDVFFTVLGVSHLGGLGDLAFTSVALGLVIFPEFRARPKTTGATSRFDKPSALRHHLGGFATVNRF